LTTKKETDREHASYGVRALWEGSPVFSTLPESGEEGGEKEAREESNASTRLPARG
jgi:hypothetical protein